MSHFLRKLFVVLCAVFCTQSLLLPEKAFAQTCTPNSGIASVDIDSFCTSGSPKLKVVGASYGTGVTHQWFSSATGTASSFAIIASATDTLYNSTSITANRYFYCVTTCASSSLKDTSNTVLVKIGTAVTNPAVTIKSTDTSICPGTPVTFSMVASGSGSTGTEEALPGTPSLTSVNTGARTATTGCVQAGGYWTNNWGTNSYWQYSISTIGYESITFSAPTSSSSTGPHTGTVFYSTDGVNFTQVGSPYTWSGTGCTSTGVFSLPAAAANKSNLTLRLVMTGASGTTGTNRVGAGSFRGKKIPNRISTSYQWKKNGNNVGTNSDSYTDNGLQHDDVITLDATANVCATPAKVTSNSIKIALEPAFTPVVTTTVSPGDTICAGTQVTFTATSVNGGTAPLYNWRKNGSVVSTSATYVTSSLNNNDIITCTVLSNLASCLTSARDTSDTIRIVVNPVVTPSVTTVVTPGDTICSGTEALFTATAINGGTAPVYQWMLNGSPVGTNSPTYSNSSLLTDDVITCEVLSNAFCATNTKDTADTIKMVVNPVFNPSVTTTISPNDTICAGTSVTFTATAVDAGTAPMYKWMVNGVSVASNTATYTTDTLKNDDVVTCEITSSEVCVTKSKDTSSAIKVTVNSWVTPSVVTTVAPNDTVCAGTQVTFTAAATNGGNTPVYQWMVNGSLVGTSSNTYSVSTLNDNDVITCEVLSNAACLSVAKDTSDSVKIAVKQILSPVQVTTTVSPNDTICEGTQVTFTATASNQGLNPTYQWMLNGVTVGSNTVTYASNAFSDEDVITCNVLSSEMCISQNKDTSDTVTMIVNPILTPVVTTTVSPNDTICAGTNVTFTANALNGGNAATYIWTLNGTAVGSNSSTYSSTTLNNNDVVVCEYVSSEMCVSKLSDTADEIKMVVNQGSKPNIDIFVSPNDTICANTPVTFTSSIVSGGTNPSYQWRRNNNAIPGATGNTWFTSTLSHGDIITCELTSNAVCAIPAKDTSDFIFMNVPSTGFPKVSVTVTPGTRVEAGTAITFNAIVTDGGINPTYEWRKNSIAIPGATSNTYTSSTLSNKDVINVFVGSSDTCANPDTVLSRDIVVDITVSVFDNYEVGTTISLYPNPNNGQFVLKGTFAAIGNEPAQVEVLNAVGAVIYRKDVAVHNSQLDTKIDLGGNINNGLHLVRISSNGKTYILKFVASK